MFRAYRCVGFMAAAALVLEGCASPPMGPTIAVMPGPTKSFTDFQSDTAICEDYANGQVAGQAEQANNTAFGSAVLGTVLGAGLGAALGGGRGAVVGAAGGGIIGTAAGTNGSERGQYGIQQRYNIAYAQCMYSKGNQVPGFYAGYPPQVAYPPPPPVYVPPPPPPPPPQ
jgi:hypothetical protein